MAQRRFFRFVTQDRDRLPRHRSRANETRESESGFFRLLKKKTVSIKRSSSPKTATFEAESRRFIGRSVRSSGSRAELLQLAQVLEALAPLSAPDAFAISVWPTSRQVLTSSIDPVPGRPKRAREAAGAAYRRTQGTSDPTSPSIDPSPRSSSTARAPSVSPPRTPPGPAPPDAPLR